MGEDIDQDTGASRRHLLRLAAAGAGAVVVGAVLSTDQASAAGSGTVTAGATSNWADQQTTIVHNGTTNNGPAISAVRTSGTTTGVAFSENAGIVAESDFASSDAVIAFGASDTGSSGVHGFAFAGSAVLGSGDQGNGVLGEIRSGNSSAGSVAVFGNNQSTGAGSIGVRGVATTSTGGLGASFEGSRAPLRLVPATTAGAPAAGSHTAGELFVDKNGGLFFCTKDGSPGTWVNLIAAAPATKPALVPVPPTRVYDSREADPAPGPLSTGQTRTLSVADGRAIQGGAVTVPDLVPAGATAIAYNFTVTNTVSAGFLTVNPGGTTTVTSSAINWSATGQILTTGSLVAISAARQITVIAGGPGSTDFLIDVVGYYR